MRAGITGASPGLEAFLRSYAQLRPSPEVRKTDISAAREFFGDLRVTTDRVRTSGSLVEVWSIVKLRRDEVRTVAVLAWILDCRGSHGKGSRVLNALLRDLRAKDRARFPTEVEIAKPYRVSTECSPLGDRENRVDIILEGGTWMTLFEVKIDAPEGPAQLERYVQAAAESAKAAGRQKYSVIYVSERMPANAPAGVVGIRWRDVARAIRRSTGKKSDSPNFADELLLQFADHVELLH